jgi:hypothetical protein
MLWDANCYTTDVVWDDNCYTTDVVWGMLTVTPPMWSISYENANITIDYKLLLATFCVSTKNLTPFKDF